MKKRISICVCLILLLSCIWTVGYAKDDQVQFNPYSVVDIVDYGDSGQEVMDYVTAVDGLECKAVTDEIWGKTISCSAEDLKNERDYYTFYFADDELLDMIQVDIVYTGGDMSIEDLYDNVGSNFEGVEMADYSEGAFFEYIKSGSVAAGCGIVDETLYVCMNGVEETDESYPIITIHYAGSDFVERFDKENN